MEQVLSGSRTRQQLAASARRRFLTWRETTNQLLAFYRAAIGTEGRGDAERPRTAAPVGAGVPG